jgi:hypothetical protein
MVPETIVASRGYGSTIKPKPIKSTCSLRFVLGILCFCCTITIEIAWRSKNKAQSTSKSQAQNLPVLLFSTQHLQSTLFAPVAQLDRVPDYESGGRTFESCRVHQSNQRFAAGCRICRFSFVTILRQCCCRYSDKTAIAPRFPLSVACM